MKPIPICLVCSILFMQSLQSQDSSTSKHATPNYPIYKARVHFTEGGSVRGYLMAIKDSSVFVYTKKGAAPDPLHKEKGKRDVEANWKSYNYKMIESIKINKQGLRAATVVTGAIAGIVAGAIIGKNSSSGSEFDESVSSTFAAVLGGLIGGAVGSMTGLAVASAFEKKYQINGDWKKLAELKAFLKD